MYIVGKQFSPPPNIKKYPSVNGNTKKILPSPPFLPYIMLALSNTGCSTDVLFGEDLKGILYLVKSDSFNESPESMVTEMQTEEPEAHSRMKCFKNSIVQSHSHHCHSHKQALPLFQSFLRSILLKLKVYFQSIFEVYFKFT